MTREEVLTVLAVVGAVVAVATISLWTGWLLEFLMPRILP